MRSKVVLIMKKQSSVCVLGAVLMLVGCSEGTVDIGKDRNSTTFGEKLSDYDGAWDGYAEAFVFPLTNESDRLRIVIDAAGQGTLQIGEGSASVPPVEATPPPGPWTRWEESAWTMAPGFAYPLHDLRVDERRLRFTINGSDLFAPWCQAQIPTYYEAFGNYACGPLSVGSDMFAPVDECFTPATTFPEDREPIECGRAMLCCNDRAAACVCTATSCAPASRPELLITADLSLTGEGDDMVGTVVIGNVDPQATERVTVRLSR